MKDRLEARMQVVRTSAGYFASPPLVVRLWRSANQWARGKFRQALPGKA
jgi:hypothetical protein